jgi:two-component system NtrC family sensor kinase
MKRPVQGATETVIRRRPELESGRLPRIVDRETAYAELLDLSTDLPFAEGPEAVVRRVLDALAKLVPTRAFGVWLVQTTSGEPLLELRLPPNLPRPERDPTRLFPNFDDERSLPLMDLPGSTIHVASPAGELESLSPEIAVFEKVAAVLSSGIRTAVALGERSPASTAEIAALRAQIMQTEKLATLGQIVAGVVHELANPVTSIAACTDFLLHKARAQSQSSEDVSLLSRIGVAADRILKFSRDLVTYARPGSEEPVPVAIHEVIEQARAFCDHEFGRRDIEFSADFAQGAGPILGQSNPLIQVFVNLFTNAAHAMEDRGGTLEVKTRVSTAEGLLYIEVADTGVGIPPEAMPKIFEPFYTTKARGRGTGLGLSIVQEIVQAHRGTVTADSAFGQGTTFVLSLPLGGRVTT